MKKQKRWIRSVIETAAGETTAMPWQRGARRAVSLARRRSKRVTARSA